MANRIRKQSMFTLSDEAKAALKTLAEIRGQNYSVAVERMIFKEAKAAGIKVPEAAGVK